MLERDAATDDPGRVINIGSVAGMIPQVGLQKKKKKKCNASYFVSVSVTDSLHCLPYNSNTFL